MAKMTPITLKLSAKQRRDLEKLVVKMGIERASVIRLAIARLVEEEAQRKPVRSPLNPRPQRTKAPRTPQE
jgi:hypothetical protein